jgi:hypothetical protein
MGQVFPSGSTTFLTDWTANGTPSAAIFFRNTAPYLVAGSSDTTPDPSGATTSVTLKLANMNTDNNVYIYQTCTLPANTYKMTYNWNVFTSAPSFNVFTNCAMRVYFGNTLLDSFQPSQNGGWTTRTLTFTVPTATTADLMLKLMVLSKPNVWAWPQFISITSLTLAPTTVMRVGVTGTPATWTGAINLTPSGCVGVLTDTPQYDLDVNGTMRVVGAATCAGSLTATTSLNAVATTVWASTAVAATNYNVPYPIPRVVRVTGAAGGVYHIPAERDGYVVPNGAVVTIVAAAACTVVGSYTTSTGTNTVQSVALASTYSQSLTAGTVADFYFYDDNVTGGLWCRCT